MFSFNSIVEDPNAVLVQMDELQHDHYEHEEDALAEKPANTQVAELEPRICYICCGGEQDGRETGRFMVNSPCNCSGSLTNVHFGCLKTWIETNNSTKCTACKAKYRGVRIMQTLPAYWFFFRSIELIAWFRMFLTIAIVFYVFRQVPLQIIKGGALDWVPFLFFLVDLVLFGFFLKVIMAWIHDFHAQEFKAWARRSVRTIVLEI